MLTNDEKLGAIYKNGTIGYTPKFFYKFLTEDIDSKDVLIIHYFILSGLWGCAKIQIQVDHIFIYMEFQSQQKFNHGKSK